MKKHVKILATLGLTMPLALTSVQASNISTSPIGILNDGTQVEADEMGNNMVLNRVTNYVVDNQDQYGVDHVNVHNDRPHVDRHTDRTNSAGKYVDSHTDTDHTDKHLDTE